MKQPEQRAVAGSRNIETEKIVFGAEDSCPTVESITMDLLAGTSYRALRPLGQGGIGAVYLAEHRDLGRLFAVKILRADLQSSPELVERLRREARAASQIHHPGIVDVTDFGVTTDGRAFVVMEYLKGQTLAELMNEREVFSQREVLVVGSALCEALAAAHRLNVIHRDVKPENIFLLRDPEPHEGNLEKSLGVKLVDFGIALSPEHLSERLTRHGGLCGTPEYVSPEQIRNLAVSPATDVYSLGVVLYEMLTGTLPFEGNSPIETMAAKMRDAPLPPSRRTDKNSIHPSLEQVVLKCLEQEPTDRYSTALELAEALSEVGDEIAELTRQNRERQSRPSRWLYFLLVIVAALSLGFGVTFFFVAPVFREGSSLHETEVSSQSMSRVVPASGSGMLLTQPLPQADAGSPDNVRTHHETVAEEEQQSLVETSMLARKLSEDSRSSSVSSTYRSKTLSADIRRDGRTADKRASTSALIAEGRKHVRNRQLAQARNSFSEAARLSPGSAAAQAGLGRVAFEQGRTAAAIEHLEKALHRRPNDTTSRVLLGSAYLRLGQRARAIQQWERVLASDPDNRAARRSLDAAR